MIPGCPLELQRYINVVIYCDSTSSHINTNFDASFPGPAQLFVHMWGEPGNETKTKASIHHTIFMANVSVKEKKQMGVVALLYLSNCCICIVGISVGQ